MREKERVLIAETTLELAQQLSDHLSENYSLCFCEDGIQTLRQLEEFRPSVLIMNLSLPGIDGLEVLQQMNDLMYRPKVILTTCFLSGYVESIIGRCEVDLVMRKPYNVRVIVQRIAELVGSSDKKERNQLVRSGWGALKDLKISPRRKGYDYLQLCMDLYQRDPLQSVTKCIYPEVAKRCRSNAVAVERAIRRLIQEAWDQRDETVWMQYFPTGRNGIVRRPTNLEFIARLAEQRRFCDQLTG